MAAVQNHGLIFEKWVKKIIGVNELATKYTQKWDVPGEVPISVKFMGLTNALEFGSTVRIWEIEEPFTLVVGRWGQRGNEKIVRSIDEITITPEILKRMKGKIAREEIKAFDERIKMFPPGKKGQKEGIDFANRWKEERKKRIGLLTITHKIDSKNQRRIQCNLNYNNYVKLFGTPSGKAIFKGHIFDQRIESGVRTYNK